MNKSLPFRSLAKIALALLVAVSMFSCKEQKPQKFIGIQLYSLRDTINKNVEGTIENLGKMGYKFVESYGYNDGKFFGLAPADFKALCEKNGLQFLSSHTGMPAPDSAKWDSAMIWWDKCIDAHVAAGVKYIVQPYMTDTAYKSLSGLKLYCKYFNAVGEKCNAKGIRFGYHNHDKEFAQIDSVTIYDYLLQNTDPSKVAMELDLWWIYKGGKNAVDYFNKYPGRFELFHVKDQKELGASGLMDFKTVFENAQKAGLKYSIVEVEEFDMPPFEGLKASLDFLEKAEYVK